jgi:hypothetical protein
MITFRNAKTVVFAKLGPIPIVPKCSVDFRRHQTSLDIDIAAHYIFYITCALLSGTFLCRFVSNNKTNCIKNKLYNLNK